MDKNKKEMLKATSIPGWMLAVSPEEKKHICEIYAINNEEELIRMQNLFSQTVKETEEVSQQIALAKKLMEKKIRYLQQREADFENKMKKLEERENNVEEREKVLRQKEFFLARPQYLLKEVCIICYTNPHQKLQRWGVIQCGHLVCQSCLLKEKLKICPFCKAEVKTTTIIYMN